ncbi:hypothetical protein [Neobacillus sp. NPDC093127]
MKHSFCLLALTSAIVDDQGCFGSLFLVPLTEQDSTPTKNDL